MLPQGNGRILLAAAEERLLEGEDEEEAGRRGGGGRSHQRPEERQQRQEERRRFWWPQPFRTNSGSTAPEEDEDEDEDEDEEDGSRSSPRPPRLLHPSASSASHLSPHPTRLRRLLPALLLFLAVAALLVTGGVLLAVYHGKLLGISEWMRARAPASAVYFCGFMALWVALCLPSTPIELMAGFVFGFPVAFAALAVGKPLGCCIAFLLGRCIAADSLRDGLLKRAHGEVGG